MPRSPYRTDLIFLMALATITTATYAGERPSPTDASTRELNAPQLTILPGDDALITPAALGSQINFDDIPIPPDFFHPGSDPFWPYDLYLQGAPLNFTPPSSMPPVDIIIRRPDPINLAAPGDQTEVPIEIVALSLQAVQPITVTYNNGNPDELWLLTISLSNLRPQTQGSCTVRLGNTGGGDMDWVLPVLAKATFTNADDPADIRVIDSLPEFTLYQFGIGFNPPPTPPFALFQVPGGVTVDHDNDPLSPEIPLAPSAGDFSFTTPEGVLGMVPICYGIKTILQTGRDLQLRSLPFILEAPAQAGAICLPDGDCIIAEPSCAADLGGEYLGDGTVCGPLECIGQPLDGIALQQVDFLFAGYTQLNSRWGRVVVEDPAALAAATGLDSGFLQVYSPEGWVVQNLFVNTLDDEPHVSAYFELSPTDGIDIPVLLASEVFLPNPVAIASVEPLSPVWVGDWGYNAEGHWSADNDIVLATGPPLAPESITYGPLVIPFERHTTPNKSNVQAARNQCVPMSVANSLQYLEDRYGLPVPDPHVAGREGDTSLVGQIGSHMQRASTSRSSGEGVWTQPRTVPSKRGMVAGKFSYLKAKGLDKKIVHRHQGTMPPSGLTPAGDFTRDGITSKDESVGGKVTFDWVCEQIKNGEDVEVIFGYYNGATRNGGHAVRVFECGKVWGVPYLGYVHDARQTDVDPGDTLGLECVRAFMVDIDGDGQQNLGAERREIDFAFSESADNDMDGVPQGLDNAPGHWNPGQEDDNGNGVGDVQESPILDENPTSVIMDAPPGSTTNSPFFVNRKPEAPDHKDVWFNGQATNNSADTAKIVVGF
ncbi:MAG TPA: hypothetical protein VLB27_10785, partial [candidate division Zixibacteria bacterium]|nr:hypothetical protein [candidate division Zixibacteria bacterium]